MATTALKIDGQNLKIMTTATPVAKSSHPDDVKVFTKVALYTCDEDFMPNGVGAVTIHEDDEETYHKKLRIDAEKAGHFVPEQSTDYKWNPNYKPEEDTNDGSETAL
jgi:hypothetical protein